MITFSVYASRHKSAFYNSHCSPDLSAGHTSSYAETISKHSSFQSIANEYPFQKRHDKGHHHVYW